MLRQLLRYVVNHHMSTSEKYISRLVIVACHPSEPDEMVKQVKSVSIISCYLQIFAYASGINSAMVSLNQVKIAGQFLQMNWLIKQMTHFVVEPVCRKVIEFRSVYYRLRVGWESVELFTLCLAVLIDLFLVSVGKFAADEESENVQWSAVQLCACAYKPLRHACNVHKWLWDANDSVQDWWMIVFWERKKQANPHYLPFMGLKWISVWLFCAQLEK